MRYADNFKLNNFIVMKITFLVFEQRMFIVQ